MPRIDASAKPAVTEGDAKNERIISGPDRLLGSVKKTTKGSVGPSMETLGLWTKPQLER